MQISIEEARGQLAELVKLAGQGQEVVLTQDGLPLVRLDPVKKAVSREDKNALLDRIQEQLRKKSAPPETEAVRSQNFLYDEFGMPK